MTSTGETNSTTTRELDQVCHGPCHFYVRIWNGVKVEDPSEYTFRSGLRMSPDIVKVGIAVCMFNRDHTYNHVGDHGIMAFHQRIPYRRAAELMEDFVKMDLWGAGIVASDERNIKEYFDLAQSAAALGSKRPEDPLEVARDIMNFAYRKLVLNYPDIAADAGECTQLIHRDESNGAWKYINPLPRDREQDNRGVPEEILWQPTIADLFGVPEKDVREMTDFMRGDGRTTSPLVRATGLARTIGIARGQEDSELDRLDQDIQDAYQRHAYPELRAELSPLTPGTSTLMRRIMEQICTGNDAVKRILAREHVECTTDAIEETMQSTDGVELRGRVTSSRQSSTALFMKSALRTIMNVDITRTAKSSKSPAFNRWNVTVRDKELLIRILERQADA